VHAISDDLYLGFADGFSRPWLVRQQKPAN